MHLKDLGVNGKVILIDDNWEEIKPLFDLLKKESISCFYLEGNSLEFDYNFFGTRMIFLDMNLWASSGQANEPHQVSRNLVGLLKKIIQPKNGPYVIAIWSKNEDENLDHFKNELFKTEDLLKPLDIFSLNKSDYITTRDIENNIENTFEKVKEKVMKIIETLLIAEGINSTDKERLLSEISPEIDLLQENYKEREYVLSEDKFQDLMNDTSQKIKENVVFCSFLLWERILKESSEKMLGELYSILSNEKNTMEEIIKSLETFFIESAEAYRGKIEKTEEYVYYSYYLFFNILKDYILKNINKEQENILSLSISRTSQELEDILKSTLNSKLHLDIDKNQKIYPGNVYKLSDDYDQLDLKDFFMGLLNHRKINDEVFSMVEEKGISKSKARSEICSKIKEDIEYIVCEISPNCDFAQNKKLFNKVIFGVIADAANKDFFNDHIENFYISPKFCIDSKKKILVFSFRSLKTNSLNDDKYLNENNFKFRIRNELLCEIQTKLSNHIGRLGIISFNYN